MTSDAQRLDRQRLAESKFDLNSGKPWSWMALRDLRASIRLGDTIQDTATFLCRGVQETAEQATKLGLPVRRRKPIQKPDPARAVLQEVRTHRWKARVVRDLVVAKKPRK
jgi:hypothetical protein